jgi:hypothetical protein
LKQVPFREDAKNLSIHVLVCEGGKALRFNEPGIKIGFRGGNGC